MKNTVKNLAISEYISIDELATDEQKIEFCNKLLDDSFVSLAKKALRPTDTTSEDAGPLVVLQLNFLQVYNPDTV